MEITSEQIEKIIENCEIELNMKPKIKFSRELNWSSSFPKEPGVYAIFDNDRLVYYGETANLKERMKEVKRTYNHSFRRKLGKSIQTEAKIFNGKFDNLVESMLDLYYLENIYFTYKVVKFGRLEIETALISRKNDLLNSENKRSKRITNL